ncbi:unnamed protein product [Parajaminaea phylloscopi]
MESRMRFRRAVCSTTTLHPSHQLEMAQGFKPLKANPNTPKKGKSTAQAKKAAQPKKGARVVPAKKQSAVAMATKKRRQTASVSGHVEEEMIGRAAGGGPLKLLKHAPKDDDSKEGKKKK